MKSGRQTSIVWGILISIVTLAAASEVWSLDPFLGPPHFPSELAQGAGIIKDKNWAIVLGKALFWDQQLGSDGQSCASCHNVGGADTRLRNQLTPGFTDITFGPDGDKLFGSLRSDTGTVGPGHMPSGAMAGPNYTLTPADMPLHRLKDETDRDSPIITTTNDRVSSQGAYDSTFFRTGPFSIFDRCSKAAGDIFYAGKYPARQVEPRNTPTVINAVYNNRNFWDGRANNTFNGVGVFGKRDIDGDPKKRLVLLDSTGKPYLGWLQLPDSSLASQAVGPPLSQREMSCDGRDFNDLGRKMLLKIPLLLQKIHAQDSVLGKPGPFGDLRNSTGRGLQSQHLYANLIKKAFDDKYWKLSGFYKITDSGALQKATILNGYTQMEHNFSMFWGIAIMMYEATLVSDQSEFDTLASVGKIKVTLAPGPATDTGDKLLDRGAGIFFNPPGVPVFVPGNPAPVSKGAGCLFCHGAPTLSENQVETKTPFNPFLNPVGDVNNVNDIRDLGFANIGIRTVFSDLLVGGTDPYGNPLSYGRQYKNNAIKDLFLQNATFLSPQLIASPGPPPPPITGGIQTNIFDRTVTKLEADGASKIPTLRNVALTPPYFLWGGYPNLRQALKVYNRGGNRRQITTDPLDAHGTKCVSGDDTGTGPDGNRTYDQLKVGTPDCNTNTTGLMNKLGLSDCEAPLGTAERKTCDDNNQTVATDDLAALERLLKSFTDPRVQRDQKPFDHPSLFVNNGHTPTDKNRDGKADDIIFELPEVGQDGYDPASGFCIPNAGDLFATGMQARSGGPKAPPLP
jgi:cytochrome c peroxidase